MRWSEDQLGEYLERQSAVVGKKKMSSSPDECAPDDNPERTLQERIERYCEEHGFYYFHDRSRGANRPGHPDLVIAMPSGRTLWLELKSRQGRLSQEQKQVILRLLACSHEAHEVRSFRQFLKIIQGEVSN